MTYIGIDISMNYFDADFGNSLGVKRFDNTPKGFTALLAALPTEPHCVMEATGPYSYCLATFLDEHHVAVSMENPLRVHRFSQSMLSRAKTDKIDAQILTQFGIRMAPERWHATPAFVAQLKQKRTLRRQLVAERTVYKNQLHAFSHMPVVDADARAMLHKRIRLLNDDIDRLHNQMLAIIEEQCPLIYRLLVSIPGIGSVMAIELITVANALNTFVDARQLAAYLGICPRIFDSGKTVHAKPVMCKLGMSYSRSLLYLCSWSAIKCNRACKEVYDRLLAKGKPKKVALVAVMNKLLHQIFGLLRSGKVYDSNYVSKRNMAIA